MTEENVLNPCNNDIQPDPEEQISEQFWLPKPAASLNKDVTNQAFLGSHGKSQQLSELNLSYNNNSQDLYSIGSICCPLNSSKKTYNNKIKHEKVQDVSGLGNIEEGFSQDDQKNSKQESIQQSTKTASEVIEFYAKFGQESTTKFFYCQKIEDSSNFQPYELNVQWKDFVEPEHFTISASGVVHVRKGVGAEFVGLSDWTRQKTMYDLLRNISYFKHYYVRRCFVKWRKVTKRKLFLCIKQLILRKLFLAKHAFCQCINQVLMYVSEISDIKFAWANANHLYQLREFADLQLSLREQKAKTALEVMIEKIQQVVDDTCQKVKKQVCLYQESIRDVVELQDTTGVELFQGKSSGSNRPMIEIKKEKIQRAQMFNRVMQEEAMLGQLIKLADYIFIEKLVQRCLENMQEIIEILKASRNIANDKQSRGTFNTTVNFIPAGMQFHPSIEEVQDVVNNQVVEGIVGIMYWAPRILFMRAFGVYFDGKPSGLDPANIIRESPQFVSLRDTMNNCINNDYQEAQDYIQVFEDHRKVYKFNQEWSLENYRSKKRSLREIRKDMHKQREWKNEIDRMKIGNTIGCLFVDSKILKSTLLQATISSLDDIKSYLLELAQSQTGIVLVDLQEKIEMLEQRPIGLDEFSQYYVMYKEQADNKNRLIEQVNQVDDMYEILSVYGQKIQTNDQIKHDDLREHMQRFHEQIITGKEFISDESPRYVELLNNDVKSIEEESLQILNKLRNGQFVDGNSNPSQIVSDLEGVKADVQNLIGASEKFRTFQQLFSVPVDDFTNIHMMEKELNQRQQIWGTLLEFLQQSYAWTTMNFLKEDYTQVFDFHVLLQNVNDFSIKAQDLSRILKEDEVLTVLKDAIEDFKQLLPIFKELCNPALNRDHWKQILSLFDTTEGGFQDNVFSMSDLVALKVMDFVGEIQSLSSDASKEFSLGQSSNAMQAG